MKTKEILSELEKKKFNVEKGVYNHDEILDVEHSIDTFACYEWSCTGDLKIMSDNATEMKLQVRGMFDPTITPVDDE